MTHTVCSCDSCTGRRGYPSPAMGIPAADYDSLGAHLETVTRLEAERDRYRAALDRFGVHWTNCAVQKAAARGDDTPVACSCGLDDAFEPTTTRRG